MSSLRFVPVVVFFSAIAWAQSPFPDLPGRDTTVKACSGCHEPERAASLHQDKDGWNATMSAMVGRGMSLSDADYTTVLNYLTAAFPAQAEKPLNINTAESIDIESALSLLRSQAQLIIAYREKHGKFKSIDDLKKIPGLDFSKIEPKKDRLAFN